MKKTLAIILLLSAVAVFPLLSALTSSPEQKQDVKKVMITTRFGVMKVKLYNETPQHRDNFIKLVKEGFYDSRRFESFDLGQLFKLLWIILNARC